QPEFTANIWLHPRRSIWTKSDQATLARRIEPRGPRGSLYLLLLPVSPCSPLFKSVPMFVVLIELGSKPDFEFTTQVKRCGSSRGFGLDNLRCIANVSL